MASELRAAINRLAGQSTFEKGVELYENNAVLSYQLDANQIKAQVQGAYVYDVNLTVLDGSFDGGCTCPVSEGFDFCEHCVAVALHFEQKQKTLQTLLEGEPADRVKGYLQTLPKEELEAELYKLLSNDVDKLNQWVMFADVTLGNIDIKEVRKRVVKAMPLRDVWRYQQVRNYFDKARKQVALIIEVIDKLPANASFELSWFALTRYDKILERIDDSGGFRFGLFHLIEKQFISAFQRIEESNQDKLKRLLSILENDFIHVEFGDIGARFIKPDNDDLKTLYFAELEKRYLKQTKNAPSTKHNLASYANSLASYYDQQGNIKASVNYAFLANPTFLAGYGYITRLISSEEYSLAEKYLEAVKERAKSYDDIYKVKTAEYELKRALGKKQQAREIAWELFETGFSVADLSKITVLSDDNEATKASIYSKAEAKIKSSLANNLPSDAKDYTPLLDFYIAVDNIPSALKLTKRYDFLEDSLHELAHSAITKDYIKDGIDLYKRLITHYILSGRTKNYQVAIDLLTELIELNTAEKNIKSDINALLAELCFTHAPKQQFINMLNKQIDTEVI